MLVIWEQITQSERLPPPDILEKSVYPQTLVNDRSLVLLNWMHSFPRPDLQELLDTGASVIAYVPEGSTLSPGAALPSVPKRLLDCFMGDPFRPELFHRRIKPILRGEPPYKPYKIVRPDKTPAPVPSTVFLATPFGDGLYKPFADAVEEVMAILQIDVKNPQGASTATITDAVIEDIDASDAIIANMRQVRSREQRGYNPNVCFEIGYAWKANKPVLLFRHVDDKIKRPADLQGLVFRTYDGALDLALQLFYGFGGKPVSRI